MLYQKPCNLNLVHPVSRRMSLWWFKCIKHAPISSEKVGCAADWFNWNIRWCNTHICYVPSVVKYAFVNKLNETIYIWNRCWNLSFALISNILWIASKTLSLIHIFPSRNVKSWHSLLRASWPLLCYSACVINYAHVIITVMGNMLSTQCDSCDWYTGTLQIYSTGFDDMTWLFQWHRVKFQSCLSTTKYIEVQAICIVYFGGFSARHVIHGQKHYFMFRCCISLCFVITKITCSRNRCVWLNV